MVKLRLTKEEYDALSDVIKALYVLDGDGYKLQLSDDDDPSILRKTVAELTEKSRTRKAKITELEGIVSKHEANNATLQTQVRQITIDGPLHQMAESISTAPELWLSEFSKTYCVEMINGKLSIFNAADGKAIATPFERDAIVKLTTDEKHPQAKSFRAITIASRASGGHQQTAKQAIATAQPKLRKFGLR